MRELLEEFVAEGADTGLWLTGCPLQCMVEEGRKCEHGYPAEVSFVNFGNVGRGR